VAVQPKHFGNLLVRSDRVTKHTEILKLWFEEINSSQWWAKDEKFDKLIVDQFSDVHSLNRSDVNYLNGDKQLMAD